jgi:tetratricopeptide (TPR) repeat protein
MTSSPPQVSEPKAVPQATSAEAKEAAKAEAAATEASSEEEGVKDHPPASATPHSDLDHHGFFDRGEDGGELSDLDGYDERMAHKNTPAAIAAREKNWMYIKVIGGVCVFLMVAGLVRSKLAPVEEPTSISPPVVVVPPPPPSAPPALAKVDTPPAPPASASPGTAGSAAPGGSAIPVASAEDLPPAAGSAKAEEAAKPGDTPVVVAPPPGPAAEPTDAEKKSAVQEKHASQAFLDQGAFAKAVEAGEKSVALDPSDGEAWLMLGAAYQSMGKAAEARRSFSSCVQEGKKGPINECRAMLR